MVRLVACCPETEKNMVTQRIQQIEAYAEQMMTGP